MKKIVVPRGEPVELGVELKDLEQKKRNPREFSISQLKEYYQYLHDMGFQSQQYYTEMLAKMAQPFLPFIMMLLAMPMGFQFGRKGSVYSMGIGILTGLSFWALFELFKGMGASGILPPPLAAWGVISVFSVVAVWRFLRMGD
jgi:lipopolysaccharide export system permease protein